MRRNTPSARCKKYGVKRWSESYWYMSSFLISQAYNVLPGHVLHTEGESGCLLLPWVSRSTLKRAAEGGTPEARPLASAVSALLAATGDRDLLQACSWDMSRCSFMRTPACNSLCKASSVRSAESARSVLACTLRSNLHEVESGLYPALSILINMLSHLSLRPLSAQAFMRREYTYQARQVVCKMIQVRRMVLGKIITVKSFNRAYFYLKQKEKNHSFILYSLGRQGLVQNWSFYQLFQWPLGDLGPSRRQQECCKMLH